MIAQHVRRWRRRSGRLKRCFSLLAAIASIPVPLLAADATAGAPRDDPPAHSWARIEKSTTSTVVDDFLNSLYGRMRILGVEYEGNQLRASRTFAEGRLAAGVFERFER